MEEIDEVVNKKCDLILVVGTSAQVSGSPFARRRLPC